MLPTATRTPAATGNNIAKDGCPALYFSIFRSGRVASIIPCTRHIRLCMSMIFSCRDPRQGLMLVGRQYANTLRIIPGSIWRTPDLFHSTWVVDTFFGKSKCPVSGRPGRTVTWGMSEFMQSCVGPHEKLASWKCRRQVGTPFLPAEDEPPCKEFVSAVAHQLRIAAMSSRRISSDVRHGRNVHNSAWGTPF